MRKYFDSNYIIWSLVSIPILVGAFLIFRQGIITLHYARIGDSALVGKYKTLLRPPDVVRAIYLTSTSSSDEKKIDWLINLAKNSELDAVIIDMKDSSGYVSYDSGVPDAENYKTEFIEIKDIDLLIKKLHENNIYVIGRMAVFQDPILARARPDWAVRNSFTGGTWYNHMGLAWIDPANREAWKYFADIARDIISRGVDEINLDYIRFPSDGNTDLMVFPAWTESLTRPQILSEFYKYMRSELGE